MTEWIQINTPWSDFEETANCRPGVQIEMDNKLLYLIGDINELAGECDDCMAFGREAQVSRCRQLVSPEHLAGGN